MNKFVLSIVATSLILVGCSNKEDSLKKISKVTTTEETKEQSVIDQLPDFNMSVNSFVEKNNKNTSLKLENPDDLDFDDFNYKVGLSKTLIEYNDEGVQYNLDAIFNNDKQFKRINFFATMPDKVNEDAISVISAAFFALDINLQYLNDFIKSDESSIDFEDNGYKVNLMKDPSVGLLNASIDTE